jgi:tricorn protease
MANHPSLSPDGKQILFDWMGEIWSVDSDGGTASRLTNHSAADTHPLFSPDGEQIAFVSNRSGNSQIHVMPAGGGTAEQITFHTAGYQLADWFPDGRSLLAVGSRDHHWRSPQRMLRVHLETQSKDEVLTDTYADEPRLSSDGKTVYFQREGERWWRKGFTGERSAQIWKYSLESDEFTELLHEDVGCRWPTPIPGDDQGFYFSKSDPSGYDLFRYRPAAGDEDARQSKVAGFESDTIAFTRISRDGSTLVFRHLFDLYTLGTDGNAQPKRLDITVSGDVELPKDEFNERLSSASEVAFSPDGLDIAFIAGGNLWVMDTELKEPVQITDTPGEESQPVFEKDSSRLWFTSTVDGQVDIYSAKRADEGKFWWQNDEFNLTALTKTPEVEADLAISADGKTLVYNRGRGELIVHDLEADTTNTLVDSFRSVDFDLSSDSRWITYAQQDNDFNNEIWIARLDGSGEPVNVSRHPDNDYGPRFSPDGKILAFTGRRVGDESDIYYVYLQNEESEKTARIRRMEKAIELMKKKRGDEDKDKKKEADDSQPKEDDSETEKDKKNDASDDAKSADSDKIEIDFEDIHERVRRISIGDTYESNLLFSPDSTKLAFTASIDGKRGWYTVEFPDELRPKFFSDVNGSNVVWSKASGNIHMLSGGQPTSVSKSGSPTKYGFTAYQQRSRSGRFREGFNAAWRTMRDVWYDPAYNNNNWSEIRRKYVEIAAASPDTSALSDVVQLMLGELNGSHLGFYPNVESRYSTTDDWQDQTAHLGARFDETFQGPGLKIRDVIKDSPADRDDSRLLAGDIIISIDGVPVDPAMDLTAILNGRLDRDILLDVRRSLDGGDEAEDKNDESKSIELKVSIRPTSYGAIRSLLYGHWVDLNRQKVDELSDGKLGYLHIRAMDQGSFLNFERELYNVGYGRDGLVIDVRDNGGGSTTDLLLTALTQPRHAITVPRGGGKGYPHDRKVFASWSKPIIVLCNQNSYSNAEIFSHAIKTLGRGKVVGVQTAGGVVSTGSATITDVGRIRVPFRGWFLVNDGEDMERNGCNPDVVIWPLPTEIPNGIDRQLEKAVELLAEDVAAEPADPELHYASERE